MLASNKICLPFHGGIWLAGGNNMEEIHQDDGVFNNQLLHSLSTIQTAKTQLRLLAMTNSTPTVLVSQIGLCDVLLGEIRAIRLSLAGRLGHRGAVRRRSVAVKRNTAPGVQSSGKARKIVRDREDSGRGLR
jgi:hypothetical protein